MSVGLQNTVLQFLPPMNAVFFLHWTPQIPTRLPTYLLLFLIALPQHFTTQQLNPLNISLTASLLLSQLIASNVQCRGRV